VTAGAVPVPDKLKLCGLAVALSATDTVAFRLPVAVGVKVTAIVQFPPAGTDPAVRQSVTLPLGVTSWKSPGFVPISETLVMVTAVDALLVSTEVICALATPVR
jgi:hypothetical protein